MERHLISEKGCPLLNPGGQWRKRTDQGHRSVNLLHDILIDGLQNGGGDSQRYLQLCSRVSRWYSVARLRDGGRILVGIGRKKSCRGGGEEENGEAYF